MLSVLRVHLSSENPIVGCELSPYVLLRRPDSTTTTDDIPEASPVGGYFLRCRWFRIQSNKREPVCGVHPLEPATLQCDGCVHEKLPVATSYHCSSKCYTDAWCHHRAMHARAAREKAPVHAEEVDARLFGQRAPGSGATAAPGGTAPKFQPNEIIYPSAARILASEHRFPVRSAPHETLHPVGAGKTYTPTAEDIGHELKLECAAVDASTGTSVGAPVSVLTSRVFPAPSPPPRRLVSVKPVNLVPAVGGVHEWVPGRAPFSLLSYNVLADLNATSDMYNYCPPWALSWAYRKQKLLREIVSYAADIMCLQEVQSDHFEEFFAPELDKHGYAAVYKKKTAEVHKGTSCTIDGCATFFRRDRFSLVKKHEVEFNKAAQSLCDVHVPSTSRKAALSRLVKDNVALVIILEVKDTAAAASSEFSQAAGKRQLLCVANAHIHANSELKDVKVWQVHTLMKGLEKIASSASIPMLVAGDFNAEPGSAPHSLLTTGRVDAVHPELGTDPLGILRPANKFSHQLPLVSAYSQFARMQGMEPAMEEHRRRMDATTNEPLFTNCTRDFLGTLDYIFYTADSLDVESLLELLDEESVRKDTALPSPEWSSDHVALFVEFRLKPQQRQALSYIIS